MLEVPNLDVLELVHVPEASPNIGLIQDIAAACWNDGLSAHDLLEEIVASRVTLWHMKGVERGVALLRVVQSPQHRSLVVDGIAGHNVLGKAQAIGQDLKQLARFFSCKLLEATTSDPRWEAVGRRLGFVPASVNYLMRIT